MTTRAVPYPPPVLPGARVGVAALSGAVDPGRLAAGLAELVRLGFEPVLAANLECRDKLFAGEDDARLAGFHDLVADASLDAIFFARGGHGVMRLMDRIDWDRLAARPRAYVGYSDLTPLLAGIVARCGFAAFHGPMVAADLAAGLEAGDEGSLLGALAGAPPPVGLEMAEGADVAEGVLAGGCLSLLAASCGTPFAADLGGSILFLEDIDEPLYRLDRMLTQLRLSGSLTDVRAMVFGKSIAPGAAREWLELVRDVAPGVRLACGLPCGHLKPNWTLPLGAACRFDAGSLELSFAPGVG